MLQIPRNINAETDLYCIFGNPVEHSKSPVLHNALFSLNNINAAYLAFKVENIKKSLEAVRELNIKGVSVTIPFKETIIDYLDSLDRHAENINAVNTIVNKDGQLKGYNTDWIGGIEPLKDSKINGKKIGIIGAGGAAYAIAYGIRQNYKSPITIINRSAESGKNLASTVDADFIYLNEINNNTFDVIINTTPCGMFPDIENSPVEKKMFNRTSVVMDIIYNPLETKFLKEAKQAGCKTIDGLSMFLYQGAEQFKIWTGITPRMDIMRKIVMKELEK